MDSDLNSAIGADDNDDIGEFVSGIAATGLGHRPAGLLSVRLHELVGSRVRESSCSIARRQLPARMATSISVLAYAMAV